MRMTVMKRMTMTKGKWRGGEGVQEVREARGINKIRESEETGEEGVSREKANDNGTDIDNNSDEETK